MHQTAYMLTCSFVSGTSAAENCRTAWQDDLLLGLHLLQQ